MVRFRMTHRALVQRDANAGTQDAYGNEQAASWATQIAAQACYYWQPATGRAESQGERNVLIYGHQVVMPLETDITEADRINGITDRRGRVVSADVFGITGIARKPDHLLLTLEVIK
jgi:hypothetical protein